MNFEGEFSYSFYVLSIILQVQQVLNNSLFKKEENQFSNYFGSKLNFINKFMNKYSDYELNSKR